MADKAQLPHIRGLFHAANDLILSAYFVANAEQNTLYLVSKFTANTKDSINSFLTPITFSGFSSATDSSIRPVGAPLRTHQDIMSELSDTDENPPEKHADYAAENSV